MCRPAENDELSVLVDLLCDNMMTPNQEARLLALIRDDPAALRFCGSYLYMHATLQMLFRGSDSRAGRQVC